MLCHSLIIPGDNSGDSIREGIPGTPGNSGDTIHNYGGHEGGQSHILGGLGVIDNSCPRSAGTASTTKVRLQPESPGCLLGPADVSVGTAAEICSSDAAIPDAEHHASRRDSKRFGAWPRSCQDSPESAIFASACFCPLSNILADQANRSPPLLLQMRRSVLRALCGVYAPVTLPPASLLTSMRNL